MSSRRSTHHHDQLPDNLEQSELHQLSKFTDHGSAYSNLQIAGQNIHDKSNQRKARHIGHGHSTSWLHEIIRACVILRRQSVRQHACAVSTSTTSERSTKRKYGMKTYQQAHEDVKFACTRICEVCIEV